MTEPNHESSQTIKRVFHDHFAPVTLSDAERNALEARLLETAGQPMRPRSIRWIPVAALLGGALAIAMFLTSTRSPLDRNASIDELATRENWERSILFPPELSSSGDADTLALFPDEYRALSRALFLSGDGV